ncbi:DUF4012 domain-containing protein [Microbacterium protaetiae]|uniref:DUF4012 domain-containing protein n=2 Tax=Microbacterium protaetiae TaxID=2509458 RepID=A0A4P6ENG1_9MICO|nr:DUF4012 domain-containing protein [Microbacterium protaetiae]
MPPETRREARERARTVPVQNGAAPTSQQPEVESLLPPRPVRKRRLVIRVILFVVVFLLLAAAGWLGVRILTVKSGLEAAKAQLSSVQKGGDINTALKAMGRDAAKAVNATGDPVWNAAELIPFAGDNLRAARLAAQTLDAFANDVALPVVQMQSDGKGKLLARALPLIEAQSATISSLHTQLTDLNASGHLIGPMKSGVEQVVDVLDVAAPVFSVMPQMLGAHGAQSYLLVFQNNAESLPLGGSSASETLITADKGDLKITAQADSGDFAEDKQLTTVDVAASATALYGATYGSRSNMAVTRPDWPSAAQQLIAFWQRDIKDQTINGVVSIDPIALERMLRATGPITVGDVKLTSKNAVKILLSDSYKWWDTYTKAGSAKSDAFFQAVAATMFEKVASADFDMPKMINALRDSVAKGDVMAWSADPAAQKIIADGRLSGELPTDNDETTTLGLYYRDVSASKIDYYLKTAANVERTCTGGTDTIVATTTLDMDITQKNADALPRYVKSRSHGSTFFSKQVFIYAPPGMKVASVTVDGRDVAPFRQGNVDLGRVVAPFQMTLRPGESATVTATFTGTGASTPLEVWTTPMINSTKLTVDDSCAAK